MSKSDDRRLLLMAVRMPIPLEEASLQLDADVEVLFPVELAVRVLHSTKRMLHHEAASSRVVASPAMSLPLLVVVEAKARSCELFSHRSSSAPQHSSLKVSRLASRRLDSNFIDALRILRRLWRCVHHLEKSSLHLACFHMSFPHSRLGRLR
jgi:hypothetical protein